MHEPASPCINACQLNANQVCRGCGRHIDEIIEWPGADAARKREIVTVARERLAVLNRSEDRGR